MSSAPQSKHSVVWRSTWILLWALLLPAAVGAQGAPQLPGPLVDSDWLARHRQQVTILDVRADPQSFQQSPRYYVDPRNGDRYLVEVGGHIPGAVLVDFGTLRSSRVIDGRKVAKLIPERQAFERLMRSYGLDQGSVVVVATRGESSEDLTLGTRLYWQLKYYGHDRLALLNGGLAHWVLSGHEVSMEPVPVAPGNWRASAQRDELLATSEDVAKAVDRGDTQLMDTRSMSQYLGTTKQPYVAAPGHIPGAKVYPTELLAEPGAPATFLGTATLRKLIAELGMEPQHATIAYCNSGQLASGGWFVLSELLGNKQAKLYDGSMHQWTLEGRPVRELKME